jgi:hypothetical protein
MGSLPQETPQKLLPEEDGEGEVEAQPTVHYVDHLRGAWGVAARNSTQVITLGGWGRGG